MLARSILLQGPGKLSVKEGWIEVLGYPLMEGSSIIIPAGRSVPAVLEKTSYTYTGKILDHDIEVYKQFEKLAESLIGYERIILIGPSDSGKSTLAAFMYNKMASEGEKPLFATVDIGQNEAFLPGFASSIIIDPPFIPGNTGNLWKACFVGSFTPRNSEFRYTYCGREIVDGWKGPIIIDTDGWVSLWDGLESKASMARSIGVDAVILVGLGDPHASFLKTKLSHTKIVRVPRIVEKSKSREERRLHRERLLAKALLDYKILKIRIGEVPVYGLPVFNGTPINNREVSKLYGVRVVYAEAQEGSLIIVGHGRPPSRNIKILRPGWERGLIVAVWSRGTPKLGILLGVDYKSKTILVASKPVERIDYIEVGKARVEPEPILGIAKW